MNVHTLHKKQTTCNSINSLIPRSIISQGGIIEVITTHKNSNELELILSLLTKVTSQDQWIAWVGTPLRSDSVKLHKFYESSHHLLQIHLREQKNHLNVLGKALSTGRCSAVIARSKQHNAEELQQLRIAAHKGKTICILLKEADLQHKEAIHTDLQLLITYKENGIITISNNYNRPIFHTGTTDNIAIQQTTVGINHQFSQNRQLSFF